MKKTFWFSKIFLAVATGIVLSATVAFAQEFDFTVEVNRTKVQIGSVVQMTATISGPTNIGEINLPSIEGFDIQYAGPRTRVTVVNGRYSNTKSYVYSLYPKQLGTLTIPSFQISINGQALASEPITIEVVENPVDDQSAVDANNNLKDKLFLKLQLSKEKAYLNEEIGVTVLLFVSDVVLDDTQFPVLDIPGMMSEGFKNYKEYQKVINGLRFRVVEFNTTMYPTRVGQLEVGPATLEANMIIEDPSSRSGLFDDSFFGNLFNQVRKRGVELKSDQIILNVLDLPKADQPEDFSGAVGGRYDFDVQVSPTQVTEGDPITFKMTITGNGNMQAIKFPQLKDNENFKSYDPAITEKGNSKVYEQVIIPKSSNLKEIPKLTFSYFDPAFGKYRLIERGPFPITVQKFSQAEDFRVVGLNQNDASDYAQTESLGNDIVFIKSELGQIFPETKQGSYLKTLVTGFFLIFLIWLGGFGFYQWKFKLESDQSFARRLTAGRMARKGLKRLKKLSAGGDVEKYYDELFNVLQQYIKNKFLISSGNVTKNEIVKQLKQVSANELTVTEIKTLFEQCEMIRYASGTTDPSQKQKSLQSLEKIILDVERLKI